MVPIVAFVARSVIRKFAANDCPAVTDVIFPIVESVAYILALMVVFLAPAGTKAAEAHINANRTIYAIFEPHMLMRLPLMATIVL